MKMVRHRMNMYPGLYEGYDMPAKVAHEAIWNQVERKVVDHLVTQLENVVAFRCMLLNGALCEYIYFVYDPDESDIFGYFDGTD